MDRREFLVVGAVAGAARALRLDAANGATTAPSRVRLSALVPRLANQGWGVLLYDTSVDGRPMRTGDRTFAHGVHTHARSDLVYLTGGRYERFVAWVGLDAAPPRFPDGTAIFRVVADGRTLFDSGPMTAATPPRPVDVALGDANVLRLIVSYSGNFADHVNWGDAELVMRDGAPGLAPGGAVGPVRRVESSGLAFSVSGGTLTGLQLADGRAVAVRGTGGMGVYSRGGLPTDGVARFDAVPGGLRWTWEHESHSRTRWTAPVDTVFTWPEPSRALVWMPWGHGWTWEDPLEPRPFDDRTRDYGAFFNREHGLSLPMATIIDRDAGIGVSFIQSPDDTLFDLQISTTKRGELRFSRAFNRFGGGSRVAFHLDVVVHEPDVRAALRAIVERHPSYFDVTEPLAHEVGGGGAYSGWEGELDTEKLTAMAFSMNWKASIDFPYMGLFLPPVADDAMWNRFAGGGEGPHVPADEGRYGQTTIRHMNDYSADMRRRGFHVLNYFNVTEFGTNIVYPPPPRTTGARDRWRDSNDLLHEELEGAVLKTPDPIFTWGKGVIVDCGDPAYRQLLLEQARRHVEKLPASSGICIDRMDWLTRYNANADDGASWIDGPSRQLRRSWISLMEEMGPIFHRAGKVVFGNDMDRRLELMKHVDGFYDEHGHFPFNLNTSAFLALRKPLVCWTPDDDVLKPDPDVYFQRLLYLGAYPTVPYQANDHTIAPSPFNERLYLDYGPLFRAIKGRRWVLEPGVVSVEGGIVRSNVFETATTRVVFLGLGGAADRARVRLRSPGSQAIVLYPGGDEETLEGERDGDGMRWDVPLRRGCAMLVLAGAAHAFGRAPASDNR